jgi:hypothetical protein
LPPHQLTAKQAEVVNELDKQYSTVTPIIDDLRKKRELLGDNFAVLMFRDAEMAALAATYQLVSALGPCMPCTALMHICTHVMNGREAARQSCTGAASRGVRCAVARGRSVSHAETRWSEDAARLRAPQRYA